jgi:hypothetical protein
MPYVEGRVIHDADAHVMETSDWLIRFADPDVRDRVPPLHLATTKPGEDRLIAHFTRMHEDPAYRARDAEEIMQRKNWAATGSFRKEDRPLALDLLGFASQLVFNTFQNGYLSRIEHGGDLDLAYGVARAHNRAMLDFCAVDRRLLATNYVPLADFARAKSMAAEAIAAGAAALLVPSRCPKGTRRATSHSIRSGRRRRRRASRSCSTSAAAVSCSHPTTSRTAFRARRTFHGGEENFRSVDYMAIPYPPMQTLATLILDGVLERFPRLMIGVIEQGAGWVPGWMRTLDSAFEAFARHEERLKRLTMKPSEYVRRQVRVTPYPTEDVGWIIEQAGDTVCLFSSDYPHVEGGRNPMRRFEASTARLSDAAKERFYCTNFVELMGSNALG